MTCFVGAGLPASHWLSSSRRRGPIRRVDIVSRKLDSLFQGNDAPVAESHPSLITHHSLHRLNRKVLRRLAPLMPLPRRDAGGFDMAAEAVGVEQRVSRATPREPGSQLRQQGLQKGSVPFILMDDPLAFLHSGSRPQHKISSDLGEWHRQFAIPVFLHDPDLDEVPGVVMDTLDVSL